MNAPLRTPWTQGDYGDRLPGFGGAKIADSGVAPIVAVARGYRTVTSRETLKDGHALRVKPPMGRTTKQELAILTDAGAGLDTLYLPWFAADEVAHAGIAAKSACTQFRRKNPAVDESGKARKYEMRAGDPTVLDLHPATPQSWIDSASEMLVIEGLAKGDAGLTAILIDGGIPEEELQVGEHETRDMALGRLSAIMERIPAGKRCLVVSIAGVGNWKATQAQWRALRPKNRTAYVAFDGDLRTNFAVWRAADRLFENLRGYAASPMLIDLGSPDVLAEQEAADPAVQERLREYVDEKGQRKRLGLDDYLTRVGDWRLARQLIVDRLPERPPVAEDAPRIGDWRVNPDGGTSVEEYVRGVESGTGRWDLRTRLGGRIVSIESARAPQSNERAEGTIAEEMPADAYETTATIEVKWEDAEGATHTERIVGPGDMLVTSPGEWAKKGVRLPAEILRHPQFPPRDPMGWLSAIKAHRQDETAAYTGWMVMGWVPTESGIPAFIIGDQVLAATEREEAEIRPCVTDRVLPGASKFGVVDTFRTSEIDDYKAQVRRDLEELYHHHFASGAILEPAVASIVVAGMFRPTIPLENPSSIYFYGPPGGGKSFFASGIMSAWQSRPDTWNENSLPGQASDTPASRELALSQVPVWVSDDWAVSADANAAKAQEAGMETAIRSTFNNSGKRRSTNSGAALAEQHSPIAQFVGTGENELTVPSIRERCIMVNVGGPAPIFGDGLAVDALRDFWVHSLVPARLCAAMIRMWSNEELSPAETTWASRMERARSMKQAAERAAYTAIIGQGVDQSRAKRPVRNAADLAMVFASLHRLGLLVGMDPDHPAMQKFDPASEQFGAHSAIYRLVAGNARRQATAAPGASLVNAIHTTLQRGRAHIGNPDHPGQPPFAPGIEHADQLNVALGWRYDVGREVWIPGGDLIGMIHEYQGDRIVLLSPESTFDAARRATEGLILPGAKGTTMFTSMWKEGLCTKKYKQRPSQVTIQATPSAPSDGSSAPSGQKSRYSGVPALLDPIVNPDAWSESREAEAERLAAERAAAEDEIEIQLG